jgi:dipeptidyl aminopeptidase/acylaminoacyl peptidase
MRRSSADIRTDLIPLLVLFALAQSTAHLGAGEDPFPTLPETVNSSLPELGLVFSPDGNELYFARMDGPWGRAGNRSTLYTARQGPDGWSHAKPLFGDGFDDGDPALSPDGRYLYFTTDRSIPDEVESDPDIWVADRVEGGWGNLRPVPGLDSEGMEFSPTFTQDGRIYFASTRPGGVGSGDIWMADPAGDGFSDPVLVGSPVSTASGEWNVLVAPDESFLIVEASGREDALSARGDLYLHYRDGAGWSDPQPLESVNTPGSDLMPRLSPDGRHVFYTSSRTRDGGDADILRIRLEEMVESASHF